MFIDIKELIVQTDHISVISPVVKKALVVGSIFFEFQITMVNAEKHVFKYETEEDAKTARHVLLRAVGAVQN